VIDGRLADQLDDDDHYKVRRCNVDMCWVDCPHVSQPQKFADALDDFEMNPSLESPWGVYLPSEAINDAGALQMPQGMVHRLGSGKLNVHFLNGVTKYAASRLLFDRIVYTRSGCRRAEDILIHPKQEGWIGYNPVSPILYMGGRLS
jgi:hypothetical protein